MLWIIFLIIWGIFLLHLEYHVQVRGVRRVRFNIFWDSRSKFKNRGLAAPTLQMARIASLGKIDYWNLCW